MVWFLELVLDLRPQFRPFALVVVLQRCNLAILHRLARPGVGDQAGHAGDAVDVVPTAGGGMGGGLA